MSQSDGSADTCDLSDNLFPTVLQDATSVALQAIIQALNLQLIHAQLAKELAVLDYR